MEQKSQVEDSLELAPLALMCVDIASLFTFFFFFDTQLG